MSYRLRECRQLRVVKVGNRDRIGTVECCGCDSWAGGREVGEVVTGDDFTCSTSCGL